MKKFTLLAVLTASLVGCGGGGGGNSAGSGGNGGGGDTPVTIPNCSGLPITVPSFATGYKGLAEVLKDNTTATYPTSVDITSYDPALYYTYNRYLFRASQQLLNQMQDLTVVVNGGAMPPIHNAVMVTNFISSNPYVASGESVTITVNYSIYAGVPAPIVPGNYTASFTCKANY